MRRISCTQYRGRLPQPAFARKDFGANGFTYKVRESSFCGPRGTGSRGSRRVLRRAPRGSAAPCLVGFVERPPDGFDARRRGVLERVLLVARRTHPRDVLRFGLPLGPFADFKVGAFWPAVFEGSPRRASGGAFTPGELRPGALALLQIVRPGRLPFCLLWSNLRAATQPNRRNPRARTLRGGSATARPATGVAASVHESSRGVDATAARRRAEPWATASTRSRRDG